MAHRLSCLLGLSWLPPSCCHPKCRPSLRCLACLLAPSAFGLFRSGLTWALLHLLRSFQLVRQHLLQHLLRSCQSKCHQCPHTVHLLLPMHLLLWALLHLQRFFHLVLQHPRQHLLRSCQSMLQHHPHTVHLLVPMHQPPCLWVL